MKKWVNTVWRRYDHFELKKKNMLVMGDSSMHKILEIKRTVKQCETKVMMVPGGLTRYL